MRRLILASSVLFVLFLTFGLFTNSAQAAVLDLTGYGWSSNIGWVNFDPDGLTGGSGVTLSEPETNRRYFNGYGWSSNIGWIKFDRNLTGYNLTTPNGAYLDTSTKLVLGWARACSILLTSCSGTSMIADQSRGGWDGWIKFGGVAGTQDVKIDLVTGIGSGKAWGSDVIGWIDFDKLRVRTTGPVTPADVTLSADSPINSGETSTLTWTSTNATNCRATAGPWSGNKTTSGSEESGALTSDTTFSITCDSATPGGSPDTATANVVIDTCSGGCCGGSCDDDNTLTVIVIGDSSITGKAVISPIGETCDGNTGTQSCSYQVDEDATISINASIVTGFDADSSIAWSGDIPASCDVELTGQSSTCDGISMNQNRTITIRFNDDDDSGELTVNYGTLTRFIKATGVNVPNGSLTSFNSTIATLTFSTTPASAVTGTLSYDTGRLGVIAGDHSSCDPVPYGHFNVLGNTAANSNIPSGEARQFRVVFKDRCPENDNPSDRSYFVADNTGGNFPIKVTVTWTDNGTIHNRAITIPLQYTESFTNQP